MSKQSIVFYMGFSNLSKQGYGSEGAIIYLSRYLKQWFEVYILTLYDINDRVKNMMEGIHFVSPEEYVQKTYDILIIYRYINYYMYFPVLAPRVYVWLQDVLFQSAGNGAFLPSDGRFLMENVVCDGLIVQTEWHAKFVKEKYPECPPIHVIGNGIDVKSFDNPPDKTPWRFIWSSSPTRGMGYMLKIFPLIHEKYPESTLYIFREDTEFTKEEMKFIENCDYIHYKGAKPNNEIIKEFQKSEFWLYPTNFCETYCISALEAQASGCLCVCTNLASLKEVVNDRGVLLTSKYGSPEYLNEIFKGIETVIQNKQEYLKKGYEWSRQQDWSQRALMWKKLLEDDEM